MNQPRHNPRQPAPDATGGRQSPPEGHCPTVGTSAQAERL